MIPILLVAGLLAQQAPQRDTRPPAPTATATVSGIVTSTDAQPRPIRRARVVLSASAEQLPRTVITGDDGRFTFEGVAAGPVTVLVSKDGYIATDAGGAHPPRTTPARTVKPGESLRLIIALPRGGVITGTVTDIDGLPATGVSVGVLARRFSGTIVSDYSYVNAGSPPVATTDDRGVYRVFGLPPGEYVVTARPSSPVDYGPGVTGRVVQVMSRGGVSPKRLLLSPTFHPGTVDLDRAARVTVRAGEERAGIDIQLEYVPLATVSGTANIGAGYTPARVTLWRLDETAQPKTGPVTTVDAQGRFQFHAVPPGRYRVSARATLQSQAESGRGGGATNVQYATAEVSVNGEDLEISLASQAALTIAGRIAFETDGPAPLALPVQLRSNLPMAAVGGWPLPPLVIDGTQFRLEGIVPGSYRMLGSMQGVRTPIGKWWLKSIAAGGRELLDAPIDLQQSVTDAVATLSDRASEISGVVTDAEGAPAQGTMVIAFTTNRAGWFVNSRRIGSVRAGANGQYVLRNLPPGEYRILATRDLQQNEWFDPSVLERLLPAATPLTIAGTEKLTVNLKQQ